MIDDDHLALVIADVSGKGVPAALFMMIAKSLIKDQLLNGCDPALALQRTNAHPYRGEHLRDLRHGVAGGAGAFQGQGNGLQRGA